MNLTEFASPSGDLPDQYLPLITVATPHIAYIGLIVSVTQSSICR